jgi:hypothetical protein
MKKPKHKKSRKGEKHMRPLSLYPITFDQALDRILTAKPKKPESVPKIKKAK